MKNKQAAIMLRKALQGIIDAQAAPGCPKASHTGVHPATREWQAGIRAAYAAAHDAIKATMHLDGSDDHTTPA